MIHNIYPLELNNSQWFSVLARCLCGEILLGTDNHRDTEFAQSCTERRQKSKSLHEAHCISAESLAENLKTLATEFDRIPQVFRTRNGPFESLSHMSTEVR